MLEVEHVVRTVISATPLHRSILPSSLPEPGTLNHNTKPKHKTTNPEPETQRREEGGQTRVEMDQEVKASSIRATPLHRSILPSSRRSRCRLPASCPRPPPSDLFLFRCFCSGVGFRVWVWLKGFGFPSVSSLVLLPQTLSGPCYRMGGSSFAESSSWFGV